MYSFVAISGSFRKGSYNTIALKGAQKLSLSNIVIDHLSIAEFPFYNFDLHEKKFPDEVEKLKEAIKQADEIIIFAPEYNFSISGVLKKASNFISRTPKKLFDNKRVGIISASPGLLGGVRTHDYLRQIMTAVNAFAINQSESIISKADTKFDESGNLRDKKTKEIMSKFIVSLAAFSDNFKKVK